MKKTVTYRWSGAQFGGGQAAQSAHNSYLPGCGTVSEISAAEEWV